MASVGVDVVEDDWDDFGIAALGLRKKKRLSEVSHVAPGLRTIGIGGGLAASPLPHHPACGSAPGGSTSEVCLVFLA